MGLPYYQTIKRVVQNAYAICTLLRRLDIQLKGDQLFLSTANSSLCLRVDLCSGKIKIASVNSVSLNGSYLFMNCESEVSESIENGLQIGKTAQRPKVCTCSDAARR